MRGETGKGESKRDAVLMFLLMGDKEFHQGDLDVVGALNFVGVCNVSKAEKKRKKRKPEIRGKTQGGENDI